MEQIELIELYSINGYKITKYTIFNFLFYYHLLPNLKIYFKAYFNVKIIYMTHNFYQPLFDIHFESSI